MSGHRTGKRAMARMGADATERALRDAIARDRAPEGPQGPQGGSVEASTPSRVMTPREAADEAATGREGQPSRGVRERCPSRPTW